MRFSTIYFFFPLIFIIITLNYVRVFRSPLYVLFFIRNILHPHAKSHTRLRSEWIIGDVIKYSNEWVFKWTYDRTVNWPERNTLTMCRVPNKNNIMMRMFQLMMVFSRTTALMQPYALCYSTSDIIHCFVFYFFASEILCHPIWVIKDNSKTEWIIIFIYSFPIHVPAVCHRILIMR